MAMVHSCQVSLHVESISSHTNNTLHHQTSPPRVTILHFHRLQSLKPRHRVHPQVTVRKNCEHPESFTIQCIQPTCNALLAQRHPPQNWLPTPDSEVSIFVMHYISKPSFLRLLRQHADFVNLSSAEWTRDPGRKMPCMLNATIPNLFCAGGAYRVGAVVEFNGNLVSADTALKILGNVDFHTLRLRL